MITGFVEHPLATPGLLKGQCFLFHVVLFHIAVKHQELVSLKIKHWNLSSSIEESDDIRCPLTIMNYICNEALKK